MERGSRFAGGVSEAEGSGRLSLPFPPLTFTRAECR